ncbi:hypothetical protein, partial [Rodentibacter ratti]|uniref:hypothetical protein n=1 Tax=Rodentibacter ratti TaxID=1906745 RepID=UPI00117B48B8
MCNFIKYLNDLKNSINGVSKSINDKNITIPLEMEKKENILSKFSHLFPILSLTSFATCSFSVFKYLSSIQSSEHYISSISIEFLTSISTIIIIFSVFLSLCLISPSVFLFDKKDLSNKELFLFFLGGIITSLIFWGSLVLFLNFREELLISSEQCFMYSSLLSSFIYCIILIYFIKLKCLEAVFSSFLILWVNLSFLLFFSSFHENLSWDEFIDKILSNKGDFIVVFIFFGMINIAFLSFINLN